MSRELLLALDLGTTGVRALVVAADGSVPARAYRPLSTSYPQPGWVEQDPVEMWERSVEVMREVLDSAVVERDALAGIGVVTQRATCLAWDARNGEPLGPALGWQDQRSAGRVAELRELGIPINTLPSATKFEWWLQNEPALQKAASQGSLRLGTPDVWLTKQLTGGQAHVTDPSNASATALYDGAGGDWAEPLLQLFGVPREALPEVVATSRIVGETPKELLGVSLPVAARAGDQQAAAFAQGVHHAGDAKLTLGTSAMLDLHTGDQPAELGSGIYPLALWTLLDGSRAFCLEGTVITAGAVVDWLVSVGLAPDLAAVETLAREAGSSQGVCFVPALQGLGTPFLDDRAKGLLTGLTRGTTRGQIACAVLEGIAQRCIDVCDALELGPVPLAVDGGLTRSELLLQALADLGGREIQRAAEMETTALGAAYLAGLQCGVYADPAACREVIAPPTCFQPTWSDERRAASRAYWARVLERARG